MSAGAIYPGSALTKDHVVEADVCIVGSGAGGSVLAARLCEAGLSVVMLEEGGYFTRDTLPLDEGTAYPRLYQEQGMRATEDAAIAILQGRAVGGGTLVNWTTSFRTPTPVLEWWASKHGVEGLDAATLTPHWEAVEQRLNVHTQPEEEVNANNGVILRGGRALGMKPQLLRRNVKGCINSGYCSMGCPTDGKQHMVITYLPDAVKKGLRLFANCRVDRIEHEGRRVKSVRASVIDGETFQPTGRTLEVRARVTALCGGAINDPAILLRSGFDPNGRTGKRTFLHPVVPTASRHAARIEPYFGAPQSVAILDFIDRGADKVGFFLESAPVHPMISAGAFGGFGRPHAELMAQLAHTQVVLGLTRDGFVEGDEGGEVVLRSDGRPALRYPFRPALQEALREASHTAARIQVAAGAEMVLMANGTPLAPGEIDRIRDVRFEALSMPFFSAHQMGGCGMGADPARYVVDSTFKHHHADNLFVVDGAVFPTSVGVNPQLTIYGLAHRAAEFVLKAAA